MATTDKHEILAVLKEITDPEIELNIVDLGLIYDISIDQNNKQITVTMTLTTQNCPMGASITQDVEQRLQASFPPYQINIVLTFDPPWSADRISPEGLKFLQQ